MRPSDRERNERTPASANRDRAVLGGEVGEFTPAGVLFALGSVLLQMRRCRTSPGTEARRILHHDQAEDLHPGRLHFAQVRPLTTGALHRTDAVAGGATGPISSPRCFRRLIGQVVRGSSEEPSRRC